VRIETLKEMKEGGDGGAEKSLNESVLWHPGVGGCHSRTLLYSTVDCGKCYSA
jgi:hypothetical protein